MVYFCVTFLFTLPNLFSFYGHEEVINKLNPMLNSDLACSFVLHMKYEHDVIVFNVSVAAVIMRCCCCCSPLSSASRRSSCKETNFIIIKWFNWLMNKLKINTDSDNQVH